MIFGTFGTVAKCQTCEAVAMLFLHVINITRKTPAGSLLYKIKLILYLQKLGRREYLPDVSGVQLLQGRGEPSAMLTTGGVSSPYALSIFRYRRKHSDTVRAEP